MVGPKSLVGLDANGQQIDNVGTPTAGTDAANKTYVDNADALKMDTLETSGFSALGWGRYNDLLDTFQNAGPQAGSMVIQTNLPFGNHMFRLHITGYNYLTSGNDIDLTVGAYAYATGPQYISHGAAQKGTVDLAQVRLMRRTSDNTVVIVLDVTGGNWQYPRVHIDGLFAYTQPTAAQLAGWSVSYTSDLTPYTAMVTCSIRKNEPTITAGTTAQYWRGDKSWQTLDKTAVGLPNVDNVSLKYVLASSGGNAIYNGSLEVVDPTNANLPDGWTISITNGATVSFETVAPMTGRKALKISNPTTSAGGSLIQSSTGSTVLNPVAPGEKWYVSGRFRASVATTSGLYFRTFWYKADGSASATQYTDIVANGAYSTTATIKDGIVTVPSDAYLMQIAAYAWFGNVAYDGYIDQLEATKVRAPQATSGVPTGVLHQFAGSTAPTGYLLCDGSAISRTTYADLFAVIGTTYGTGDGSTTFNIPDMRSRLPVGVGSGRALASNEGIAEASRSAYFSHSHTHTISSDAAAHSHGTSGAAGSHVHAMGDHSHTGSTNAIGDHDHTVTNTYTFTQQTNTTTGGSSLRLTGATYVAAQTTTAGSHAHTVTTGSSGSSVNTGSAADHSHTLPSANASHSHGGATLSDGSGMHPYLALNYIIKT